MRKWLVLLAAVLMVLPAAGYAAVQGSLHDMDAYSGTEGKVGGACAYCHIPHGAQGDKLYKDSTSANDSINWIHTVQPVSRICETCHNATGGGIIDSSRYNVAMFNDNAHKWTVANMTAWGDNAALAGIKLSTNNLELECTSCHDPHETDNRPFLKYVTSPGDNHENCVTCHVNRDNPGPATGGTANHIAWNTGSNSGHASQHPTNTAMSSSPFGDQVDNWQGTINAAFSTAAVTTTSQAVVSGGSGYWSSKGKYGLSSTVGCQTCHAVHGVESGTGGATGTVSFHNQTQKGTGVVVLAMDRTPTSAGSVFCQGCHLQSDLVNATGAEHPVNDDNTAWGVKVNVGGTTWAQYWTWGSETNDRLMCETCHDVHYGSDNTAILRKKAGNAAAFNGGIDNQLAADYATVGAFCNECHATSPGATIAFASGNHHPVSYEKDGTTVLALDFEGGPAGGQNINVDTTPSTLRHATAANVGWADNVTFAPTRTINGTEPVYTWGSISGSTVMVCGTCHGNTGSGAAGAHTLAFPLDTNTESEMCVDCHTFNPSAFVLDYEKGTTLNDNSIMTHYVGKIITGTYKRTTAFTGGPAAPKYSADGGGDGSIICESCHYWKSGNLLSINVGATGHTTNVVQDNVYGMLGASGNAVDTTTAADYLCSGCHGTAPGGGSSHPTVPNNPAVASSGTPSVQNSITAVQTNPEYGRATLNTANKVNCDSCHRAHNATKGTGALILEANYTTPDSDKPAFQLMKDNTAGSQLNQEGLCQRCHVQGQ